MLGIKAYATMLGLEGTGNESQDFVYVGQAVYQLSNISSCPAICPRMLYTNILDKHDSQQSASKVNSVAHQKYHSYDQAGFILEMQDVYVNKHNASYQQNKTHIERKGI